MRLSTLLNPRLVKCGLTASTKEESLREMAELVASAVPTLSSEAILSALIDREKQGPFSMGRGIAFPHARTEEITDFTIAIGTSARGLDFRAPDGHAVRVLILFLIPRKHSNLYLHTLAAFLSFFQIEENNRRVLAALRPEDLIAAVEELTPGPKGPAAPDRLPYQPVSALHLDTPVAHAAERFRLSGLDELPVLDISGELLGELRAHALLSSRGEWKNAPATPLSAYPALLQRGPLPSVEESATPEAAATLIVSSGSSHAYVLRGRRLVGRITARDLLLP